MLEKKKLGEMLAEAGLLSEEQLNDAVLGHKLGNLKLGEYLVREGLVSGAQIADLLSTQGKIEKYQPDQ